MNAAKRLSLMLVAGGFLAGCAIAGAEFDVPVRKPDAVPTKSAVVIVAVNDKRRFIIDPLEPSQPSIYENEIGNKALTERALGRKRDTFGRAGHNVYLPTGKTISGLVRDVLTAALADKGYKVVEKSEAGYGSAGQLSADIEKFWSWSNPGAAVSITFHAEILLTGPWPVPPDKRNIRGNAKISSYVAIGNNDWEDLERQGVDDLRRNLVAVLP